MAVLGGEGLTGESEVYVIEHKETKRRLVAKTFQDRYTGWGGLLQLQIQDIATRLLSGHPSFLQSYGLLIGQDRPWLIVEYFDGIPLSRRLLDGGYRFADVLDWWVQVVGALGHIRSQGQVFLDLSPMALG